MTAKDRWWEIYVIPLFPLLGVNNRQPLIYIPEILVYMYAKENQINHF